MAEQETIIEPNIRWERRQARLALIKEGKPPSRIRVHPSNDVIKRDIKHPLTGRRFPDEGSVEWPNDQFTKRRLRDGTVRAETHEEMQARSDQRKQDRGEAPSEEQRTQDRRNERNGQRQRQGQTEQQAPAPETTS